MKVSFRTNFLTFTLSVCFQLAASSFAHAQTYYNSGAGWQPVGKAPVDVRWTGPGTYSNVANSSAWAGVYANAKIIKGQASFQLGIKPDGNLVRIVFNAAYHDGHGVSPEAQGSAKAASKDTLAFKFTDSFKNSGSGTIKRAGNDIIVDFLFASAADKRCLEFYGRNMYLRRIN